MMATRQICRDYLHRLFTCSLVVEQLGAMENSTVEGVIDCV